MVGRLFERHVDNVKLIRVDVTGVRFAWREHYGTRFTLRRVDTEEEVERLCRALAYPIRGCPLPEDVDYSGYGFPNPVRLP